MGSIVIADGLASNGSAEHAAKAAAAGRKREVWTNADRMLFDRFAKMVRGHGDRVLLKCGAELCPDRVMKLEEAPGEDRGAALVCGCTVRVFSKA